MSWKAMVSEKVHNETAVEKWSIETETLGRLLRDLADIIGEKNTLEILIIRA